MCHELWLTWAHTRPYLYLSKRACIYMDSYKGHNPWHTVYQLSSVATLHFACNFWFVQCFVLLLLVQTSQTWANDHLWIMIICLLRLLFWGPNFNVFNIKLSLNNDHLSTTATNFGYQWSLYKGLTVCFWHCFSTFVIALSS